MMEKIRPESEKTMITSMSSFQQSEFPDPSQHAATCLMVLEQERQKESVVTDEAKAGQSLWQQPLLLSD